MHKFFGFIFYLRSPKIKSHGLTAKSNGANEGGDEGQGHRCLGVFARR